MLNVIVVLVGKELFTICLYNSGMDGSVELSVHSRIINSPPRRILRYALDNKIG